MAVKSFTRGSSVYTCRCCGRTTRAARDMSEGDTKLCAPCYELAGWENTFNDYGADEVNVASVASELKDLSSKGVSNGDLARLFPDLWNLVHPTEAKEAPAATRAAKYDYPAGLTSAQKKAFRAKARRSK